MPLMPSFRENPRLHANVGVCLALSLIGAAVVMEVRHGERGRPATLILFLASYPFAAYGCGGYAASKGYGVWWGILPAILGLNLLALTHLSNLPDRAGTWSHVPFSSRIVDSLLLLLTAAMVIALLTCVVLAWGGRIEPEYRMPGKIGVFICFTYFYWLFWLTRLTSSSEEREWR